MSSLLDGSVLNATLYEILVYHVQETVSCILEFVNSGVSSIGNEHITKIPVISVYDHLSGIFNFDEFQVLLLKTFLLIFFVTLFFIFISWRVYGERISERFMQPATSIAIEKLKESVSKLKLPKEHTPRI